MEKQTEYLYLISYPGSKIWFIKKFRDQIIREIEKHKIEKIIDPFGGGGSFILI